MTPTMSTRITRYARPSPLDLARAEPSTTTLAGPGQLDEHPDVEVHQLGPDQLHGRADHGDPGRHREHCVQVGEQRRRVPDRILRSQDPPCRPGREPRPQRVHIHAPVEREQAAHGGQREPEPDLDRRERGAQGDQQRIPGCAAGSRVSSSPRAVMSIWPTRTSNTPEYRPDTGS